jgi:CheY-like chemotaxis protein
VRTAVDDNKGNRTLLARVLKSLANVTTCELEDGSEVCRRVRLVAPSNVRKPSGPQAVEYFQRAEARRPDLILMDRCVRVARCEPQARPPARLQRVPLR